MCVCVCVVCVYVCMLRGGVVCVCMSVCVFDRERESVFV